MKKEDIEKAFVSFVENDYETARETFSKIIDQRKEEYFNKKLNIKEPSKEE